MKKILAAIDGSEASLRALEHAAYLAKGMNADLVILLVRLIIVGRKGVFPAMRDEEIQDIQTKARDQVLSVGGVSPEILVEPSRDTAFKIVDVAIDKDVDLIVMGASGKGGFKTFLLGSVSQEVLRKSACPVTIVH